MKKILLLAAAAGMLAVPGMAIAEHHGHGQDQPMTRAQLQQKLDEKFAKIDTNKDGAITKAESDAHREAMKKEWAAKRAERHNERFTAMDTDKDGQISKAEFDAAHAARAEKWGDGKRGDRKIMRGHHMGNGEMRGDMFAKLDANSDGKVTKAEFTAKPLEMFGKADANKDGTVTPEERKAAWEKMRSE